MIPQVQTTNHIFQTLAIVQGVFVAKTLTEENLVQAKDLSVSRSKVFLLFEQGLQKEPKHKFFQNPVDPDELCAKAQQGASTRLRY